ncbi:flagellar basal body rod protein FlgB [Rhizobiales bacterium RZME27]|jgi:flagellar basal-body rod protein FlgB|uniref:Flagellar basal body rod protein FlgB n=1 Tax=Endobacterium cereale TaxID=2663029 RepID=A0A6A8AH28_9HYPH|nr:flagellar basal body rod protein FlgB [Endobacterium cereale]MEB2848244.1 flagellar basal body rod protein FlgB [Endobacterium cereale]MQY48101.1 flagellar basal body rod protein FlgB [Endobacterium cereale]
MQPIQLFALASKQAEWLSVRQEVVANNIANANTPQYKAKDVASFDAVLDNTSMRMARTNAAHFGDSTLSNNVKVEEAALNDEIGIQESGNTVALSKELSKAGEVKRQYELSANLVKSFNSMMLLTVKR